MRLTGARNFALPLGVVLLCALFAACAVPEPPPKAPLSPQKAHVPATPRYAGPRGSPPITARPTDAPRFERPVVDSPIYSECAKASTEADIERIPQTIQSILSTRYRSWTIAAACKEIAEALAITKITTTPSVVVGDFDNDGAADYSVLLARRSPATYPFAIVVAFLDRGDTFMPVYGAGGGEFISLVEKGRRDYSYDTNPYFTHATDAIYTGTFEKTGGVLMYRNGRFIGVHTVD